MSYIMAEIDSPFDIFYLWLQRKKERKKERRGISAWSNFCALECSCFPLYVHQIKCCVFYEC